MTLRDTTGTVETLRLVLLAAEPERAQRLLAQLLVSHCLEPADARRAARLLRELATLSDCWAEELERGPVRETMLRMAKGPLFGRAAPH